MAAAVGRVLRLCRRWGAGPRTQVRAGRARRGRGSRPAGNVPAGSVTERGDMAWEAPVWCCPCSWAGGAAWGVSRAGAAFELSFP